MTLKARKSKDWGFNFNFISMPCGTWNGTMSPVQNSHEQLTIGQHERVASNKNRLRRLPLKDLHGIGFGIEGLGEVVVAAVP